MPDMQDIEVYRKLNGQTVELRFRGKPDLAPLVNPAGPQHILAGYTAYDANGNVITGTAASAYTSELDEDTKTLTITEVI